jgi:hypothetical protein
VSSGRIAPSADALWRDLFGDLRGMSTADRRAADALRAYLVARQHRRGDRAAVPGWHRLWL